MIKKHSETILLFLFLAVFGFCARLLPHPANIAPIAALALFGALYLPKRVSIVLPLFAMVTSDFFIGFYQWQIMLSVYASFITIGCIGLFIRNKKNFFTIGASTLSGSILFFLITNAAVWEFSSMYPKTFQGLIESYTMALPFFRNTLLGDIFYSTLLIGGFELVGYALHVRKIFQLQSENR